MTLNKSKVAVGFIIAGVLTVFFGTVLTFVGPLIIDDQIVKVSGALTLLFRPFSMLVKRRVLMC